MASFTRGPPFVPTWGAIYIGTLPSNAGIAPAMARNSRLMEMCSQGRLSYHWMKRSSPFKRRSRKRDDHHLNVRDGARCKISAE